MKDIKNKLVEVLKSTYCVDYEERECAVVFLNGNMLTGESHASCIDDEYYMRDELNEVIEIDDRFAFGHKIEQAILIEDFDEYFDNGFYGETELEKVFNKNSHKISKLGVKEIYKCEHDSNDDYDIDTLTKIWEV